MRFTIFTHALMLLVTMTTMKLLSGWSVQGTTQISCF